LWPTPNIPAFASSIPSAIAGTTTEFIAREPKRAKQYTAAGRRRLIVLPFASWRHRLGRSLLRSDTPKGM
jgi:hypothetical protein